MDGELYASPATLADHDTIRRLARDTDGPLVGYWLARQPESFELYRRSVDDEPISYGADLRFTDTRGTPDDNLKSSQKRADAVAAELRGDGIDGRRLSATGMGRLRLKIKTGDGVSEPRNRRIEIRIVPKPG